MVNHATSHSWPYRLASPTLWCCAGLIASGLYYTVLTAQNYIANAPAAVSVVKPAPATVIEPARGKEASVPFLLSKQDIALYEAVFQAQKTAHWTAADAAIIKLDNRLLLGHVLAMRYLDRHYTIESTELVDWLNRYADHPEAADIYAAAIARTPSLKDTLPQPHKPAPVSGYGDDNGLASSDNAPYTRSWNAGLTAWRLGRHTEAAKAFADIARNNASVPSWVASAAAYWAYRSYHSMGDAAPADTYLHLAASKEPRSFYGILAGRQLKQPLVLDTAPVALSESDLLEMIGEPAIHRTIALAQTGENELAEKELRAHFPRVSMTEKFRLLALAHQLNLPAVQIGMGKILSHEGHELDFARYPIPDWKPEGGFTIDPALMLALMRQESGFRVSAVSSGGALGVMQLMPQTAALMQKKLSREDGNVIEPVMNITLGQNYIQRLLSNDSVQGNLIYMLAAYNAGPGRLQSWKSSLGSDNDPLLFVESIPNAQTRNYVMQVMANYWIYSELTGTANYSVYALMNNRRPVYDGYTTPLAERKIVADAGG